MVEHAFCGSTGWVLILGILQISLFGLVPILQRFLIMESPNPFKPIIMFATIIICCASVLPLYVNYYIILVLSVFFIS